MKSPLATQPVGPDADWFASWFDSFHYHRLYAHRDAAEAAGFVDALIAHLKPSAGASMVDLGCGSGRHARRLPAHGFNVTGFDLAPTTIDAAKRFESQALHFRRHDMRLPFGERAYDYVFSFFTSFGYFDDPSEQDAVIGNMARSLKSGGHLVFDYLNPRYADEHMKPAEDIDIGGTSYRIRRWTDGRCFYKRITIDEGRGGEPLVYREQVARFSLGDFERLLTPHGLEIVALYGDYRLNPYDAPTSPRLVLIARQLLADAADGLRRHAEIGREHPLRNAPRQ
jgi:SAM-dependent methyltransferase